ncbi:MAG: carboxypeptidase regulatory-like domain-containing protein, partial [Thermoplasmata archaeon]|nr:carboxypeptidase regulatory-like domain-containing protein [Thermoplasmata archaeon]
MVSLRAIALPSWAVAMACAALVLVSGPLPGTAGAQAGAPPTHAPRALGPVPPAAEPLGPPILPGADPSGEPFVDAAALALAELGSSSGKATSPEPLAVPAGPPQPVGRPTTLAASNATGSVVGRVVDSANLTPIVNASVLLTLISGSIAGGTATNGSGDFQIDATPGVYVIIVNAANYSNNTTQVQIYAARSSNLGILRLVEDGFVVGIVRASDPSHEPIANATLVAVSRNRLLSVPVARSTANGSFRIAVPPTTDLLSVGAPSGREGEFATNFTFVAPGSGRTVNLGTFYLIEGTKLALTVRDRATHAPIGPKFGSKVFTCSKITNGCPLVAGGGIGPNLTLWAVPGPTILHLLVIGYVVNVTPIADVPSVSAGVTVAITANVTPLGVVQITPGVTGGMPTVGGNYIPTSKCNNPALGIPGGPFWIDCQTPDSNISGLGVCSLTGIQVAVPTSFGIVPVPCFPNIVNRFGVAGLFLGPPLRDYIDLGSFLGVAPMFRNESWVNLTSDRLTDAGYLNFTPGGYLAGHVFLGHTKTPPLAYTLQACSTDETWICGPAQSFPPPLGSVYPIDPANATLVGCPKDSGAFCIAAPPGPVRIVATGSGASHTNWTWFQVPPRCCVATPSILWYRNLTGGNAIELPVSNASVYGRIVGAPRGIEPPLGGATVKVCPAEYGNPAPCEAPASVTNLSFQLLAPLGWDSVEIGATAYATNRTWVDVTGRNNTGTIVLDPLAIVEGRVLNAHGTGVLGASLSFCPVS